MGKRDPLKEMFKDLPDEMREKLEELMLEQASEDKLNERGTEEAKDFAVELHALADKMFKAENMRDILEVLRGIGDKVEHFESIGPDNMIER